MVAKLQTLHPYLSKVEVVGSNPIARSSFFNGLVDYSANPFSMGYTRATLKRHFRPLDGGGGGRHVANRPVRWSAEHRP